MSPCCTPSRRMTTPCRLPPPCSCRSSHSRRRAARRAPLDRATRGRDAPVHQTPHASLEIPLVRVAQELRGPISPPARQRLRPVIVITGNVSYLICERTL